jgi:urea transport system permease protein
MIRVVLRLILACMVLAPLLARAPSAVAQEPDPFAGLSANSFDDVIKAIGVLAASGNPRAAVVIKAITNDALDVGPDDKLLIQLDTDKYADARTGAAAPGVTDDDVNEIKVNNDVRAAAQAALGSLDLFSPDAATRLRAAGEIFHNHPAGALPGVEKALAAEKNQAVAAVLRNARAAILIADGAGSEADRIAAVATLRDRGGLEARALLTAVPATPESVHAEAMKAVAAIDRAQALLGQVQNVIYGLSLGSVLLLAAAGLAITFGVMGVINMAHGELVMLGAYTTYVVQLLLRAHAPGLMPASLFIAVPLAFLVTGAAGIVIERCLIRFLYGRPLETLLATWGLSLGLQQAVRSLFGADNRDVSTPLWMQGGIDLGGLTLTWNRVTIIVFAAMVLAALMAVLRYTAFGLRMRAVTQNRRMAASMGIRTPWIDALTFGLGAGVAGMAGVALSQIDNVSPNLGQGYIVDSFMVVVFGGVGNLWGTVVSAMLLGVINKILEPFAGAVLGKIVVLVLLILFIQRKPRGLFPIKGRAVEA